jgi:hydrogenase expression/formation protein HypE
MKVKLSEGSGGSEMNELIGTLRKLMPYKGKWQLCDDDSAVLKHGNEFIVFTTDSFIVDPLFFPGGNIGHIAFSGTLNDLAVMGAEPLGLSLSFVIEEGFEKDDLNKIIKTIGNLSKKYKIPVVTGDTKVMEKGKVDKLVVNTSGVGIAKNIFDKKINPGDKIIVSGSIGDHTIALLSKRFDYETGLVTDSKPVIEEIRAINKFVKQAKDPTRGGLASVLNELSKRNKVGMIIDETNVPFKKEVRSVTEMLGLDIYTLASEGRFVCVVGAGDAEATVGILKKFNTEAALIGEITPGNQVIIKTKIGTRLLPEPTGSLVPRIC